ncbi:MAG: glycoside hydrolase [Lentisphaeria bacterium]|nr:glycoside hydrolase [Lentisphaeria bacterium]
MRIDSEKVVEIGGETLPHTFFPGVCRLSNGNLLMLLVTGSGFESSDQRLEQFRSVDNGRTWQRESEAFSSVSFPVEKPFTPYAKPTVLRDGTLVAIGYGFYRDQPQMGLSDYAEKYGKFPPCKNFAMHCDAAGKHWQGASVIDHSYDGLEISGPALSLPDGRILFFAAPFVLNASLQQGLVFESLDNGRNWHQISTFFSSANVAPWEVRSLLLPSGRILLILWAFDLKENKHLTNRLVYSDDGGLHWSAPVDTTLHGQASNWMLFNGNIGVIQARREGREPGIYLNGITLSEEGRVTVSDECRLFDARGLANQGTTIEEQFVSLKFGQPSVTALSDNEYLLAFWSFAQERYAVRTMRFRIM